MYGLGELENRASKFKLWLVAGVAAVLIVAVSVGVVLWRHTNAEKSAGNSKDTKGTSERVIDKVGKLYELPTGEEPTVAAIQDKNKLNGQPFFEKAKNGDYLLVYTKAKLALLYREQTGKLINVGPVNMQDTENATTGQNGTPSN